MNETIKQPEILSKISFISEKLEKLTNVLSPVTRNMPSCSENCDERKPQSLALDRLDDLRDKVDYLLDNIDIS